MMQASLFDLERETLGSQPSSDPVECLGMIFPNDEECPKCFLGKLREFEEYRESKQKRLTVFRREAIRAGFKKAWQDRDYATIIAVARKIPENVLQEDLKLLMWYDQAVTRTGTNS
jgi:hypothetical protein